MKQPTETACYLMVDIGSLYFEIRPHIVGNGGLKFHFFAVYRMVKLQPPGVEHLPRRNGRELLVERAFAVNLVADDRTAERGHMHADLVRPPRLDTAFKRA